MRIATILSLLCVCSVVHGESKVIQAPNPDSEKYHELAIHIPDTGAIKYEVRRVADVNNNGSARQLVAKYAYRSAYQLRGDHYVFLPRLVSSDLESINGSPPPQGFDPQLILAGLVLMDGVSYSTDRALAPEAIEDMAALKANYRKMLVNAQKSPGGNINESAIDSAVTTVFGMYDESSATELFMVEQTLLGSIHGAGLELGRPTKILMDEPGSVGGVPIKVQYSLSLEAWDAKKNTAVASVATEPDANDLKRYVSEVVPRLMSGQGAPPPSKDQLQAMLASAQVSHSTKCRYEIVISTGFISKAECTVIKGLTIGGNGQLKTDQYTIRESIE